MEAWKHSNFLWKNYILSDLQDDLYNMKNGMKTSKESWDALEQKYKTEDAGAKRFFIVKFLDFKMIDSLIVNEAFQVASIIEKLPPLWKNFKNYLKHKRKKMLAEGLIVRLCIEEDNKAPEKQSKENSTISRANIMEDDSNNSKKQKKNPGNCWALKKRKKKDPANMDESKNEVDNLYTMLSEYNLVGNPREWWIDFGVTCHVYANKELFDSYAQAQVTPQQQRLKEWEKFT
ncbi:uncharacterized protein LOC124889674 [Capsicum annuum]|uniref:uncharacterized protein LOC124889674 n=1 Tax=Capsicum annuum TaxID=4072 RepID=UPI001FB1537E|nr:uncharacterized protein LOC124889674 [Capsicum annuum]